EVRARRLLCAGKRCAGRVRAHRGLGVDGRAVVAAGLDAAPAESRREVVGALVADDVEVPGGVGAGRRLRQRDVVAEAGALVGGGGGAAGRGPGVEIRQLDAQQRRLELVEAAVVADVLVG